MWTEENRKEKENKKREQSRKNGRKKRDGEGERKGGEPSIPKWSKQLDSASKHHNIRLLLLLHNIRLLLGVKANLVIKLSRLLSN